MCAMTSQETNVRPVFGRSFPRCLANDNIHYDVDENLWPNPQDRVDKNTEVQSSHYYLHSAFNNANCVKAALHQLDIKLGGFTSALQYLDEEIVLFSSGQTISAV